MESILKCNANQIRQNVIRCIKAGLVPFIQSSPGIGKSSIVKQIAKENNLELIDHRLSTSSPEDLLGLPHFVEDHAVFSPFRDVFPLSDSPLPRRKNGWLLFFDEFNSAPRSVQAACYKIILDREVGQHKLHPNCVIVCAGNLLDDNAITVNLSTAMQSRLVHLVMECDFNTWFTNVALKENYDERVSAYLNMYPNHLMQFDPNHTEMTFACPRTWEFVNRLVKNESELDETMVPLLSGTISSEIALSFVNFCKIRNELITVNQVIANPDTAPIPEKNEAMWSTVFHLLNHVDKKNFKFIAKYIHRYSVDYQIIFYRAIKVQHPELCSEPEFIDAMINLASYFE